MLELTCYYPYNAHELHSFTEIETDYVFLIKFDLKLLCNALNLA